MCFSPILLSYLRVTNQIRADEIKYTDRQSGDFAKSSPKKILTAFHGLRVLPIQQCYQQPPRFSVAEGCGRPLARRVAGGVPLGGCGSDARRIGKFFFLSVTWLTRNTGSHGQSKVASACISLLPLRIRFLYCSVLDTDQKLAAFLPRLKAADWIGQAVN